MTYFIDTDENREYTKQELIDLITGAAKPAPRKKQRPALTDRQIYGYKVRNRNEELRELWALLPELDQEEIDEIDWSEFSEPINQSDSIRQAADEYWAGWEKFNR